MALRECSSRTGLQIALELTGSVGGADFERDEKMPRPISRGVFILPCVVPLESSCDVRRQSNIVSGGIAIAAQHIDESLIWIHASAVARIGPYEDTPDFRRTSRLAQSVRNCCSTTRVTGSRKMHDVRLRRSATSSGQTSRVNELASRLGWTRGRGEARSERSCDSDPEGSPTSSLRDFVGTDFACRWLALTWSREARPRRSSREARAKSGGESGIRTHGRVSPTHAFQACSFNHSDISPL